MFDFENDRKIVMKNAYDNNEVIVCCQCFKQRPVQTRKLYPSILVYDYNQISVNDVIATAFASKHCIIKADQFHSLKNVCILSENVIFHE